MTTDDESAGGPLILLVADLLEQLRGTVVTECELRVGSQYVRLRRNLAAIDELPPSAANDDIPPTWQPVQSPLTGIFYLTETPQSPPFVSIGARVAERQVVGLIESMKMYNPVESDLSGVVCAILVQNNSVVEQGQILLYVEPAGEQP
jgi:acetyl/propionyl-CoA carboxylase alpha subunit